MSVTRHLLLTNVYNGKVFLKTHAVMQIQAQKHPSQSPNTHQQYKIESFRVFLKTLLLTISYKYQTTRSFLEWYHKTTTLCYSGAQLRPARRWLQDVMDLL